MKSIARRLQKLETRSAPPKPLRLVVRYEDSDLRDPDEQRDADIDANDPNTLVVVVQYVDVPARAPLGPARSCRSNS